MAVSQDVFSKEFISAGHNKKTSDESDRKIEDNEQFIIELLSKTQPHHDHGYTTVFGKRNNPDHVEELLGRVEMENEPDLSESSWKTDLNLQGIKEVIFIDPADSKRGGKRKRPAPILFLRHR